MTWYYVQPTDSDVAETGLSWEVLCVIIDTPLFRDLPGPDESPDFLRRYLRQEPYENLGETEYRALMEEAVELWPQSRYAHASLAYALLAGHGEPQSLSDRQRAADEFLTAAEIAFSQGKVRYQTEIAQLLGDLGDTNRLDRYFSRAFELLPEGTRRYQSYLQYALALAKLCDDQAATFFHKAIEVSPPGVGEAYEFYAGYLLETQQAQAVLDLLKPDSKAQDVMSEKDVFHYLRCQALEQLDRGPEAEEECQRAREFAPPVDSVPSLGVMK